MSFFQQSTFNRIFTPDENRQQQQQQNFRTKMPKIDLDPLTKVFSSIFSPKPNAVKSVCENCNCKFNFAKKKKVCNLCSFEYCSSCFEKETNLGLHGYSTVCIKCRVFSKKPLKKEDLMNLKVKDLKWFLRSKRISFAFAKEKSDLVELIILNFGLRPSNQPSTSRSFDGSASRFSEFSSRGENASESHTRNQNSNNSIDTSTLESEWEFLNDRFSSINSNHSSNRNSNNNSNRGSTNNSNRSSNHNSNNQTPTTTTPINRSNQQTSNLLNDLNTEDFLNLEIEIRNEETNGSNETNFSTLDDASSLNNLLGDSNQTEPQANQTNDDLVTNRTSRADDNLNSSRRTASTSRLTNSNLNNLNNNNNNLSDSTESLSNFKPFNIADVKDENEIRNLSIRQLKLVLTRNYVNYKGCCEKDELLEKAIRLWKQIKKDNDLLKEDDLLKDDDLCKICMENVINCAFLDCGHLVTCLDCGKQLSECCVCRQYIVRTIRIFKA